MKATLDGRELTLAQPTLSAAIEAAATAAQEQGRIVIEVAIDGCPLDRSVLDAPNMSSMAGEHVAMTSADPLSLVRVTLFDAADAMESSREEHEACAAMIHKGELGQAMAALAQLLATWQAVREAIVHGGLAVGQPLETFLAPGCLVERTEALSRCLDSLKRAVGDDDLSTVADILEDDLHAEAGLWAETLRQIAGAMRED